MVVLYSRLLHQWSANLYRLPILTLVPAGVTPTPPSPPASRGRGAARAVRAVLG